MNRLDKSVLLGSVLLTFMGGLTSSKAVIASTFECAETVSFCVKMNGDKECAERLTVCNKYKQDVLKCEQWVDAYDIRVDYRNTHSWSCGSSWHCTTKKSCYGTPGRLAEYKGRYGSGCRVGEGRCEVAGTCPLPYYTRVNVKVCSRWDINVKFGNAEIDPNLIEY